jgi:hypothetical protein
VDFMNDADNAHGWASAATFMEELVRRWQDAMELPVPGWQRAAIRFEGPLRQYNVPYIVHISWSRFF